MFFLFLIAPLLIFSIKRFLVLLLVWIFALGIQFLAMFTPSDDLLRYWFTPSLLMCAIFALGAETIRNRWFRAAYILFAISLFALNTTAKNKEVKLSLKNKSRVYKTIADTLLDKKFSDSRILLFEDSITGHSAYIKIIDAIYSEKLGIRTYPAFIPADFLVFFPELGSFKYNAVHEMKQNEIIDITPLTKEKLDNYLISFPRIRPSLELTDEGETLKLDCNTPSNGITFYMITKRKNKFSNENIFYDKLPSRPNVKEIKMRSLTKLKNAKIVPKESLSFHEKNQLQINGKELLPFPSEAIIMISCITADNKITFPSDILYLKE